MAFGLFFNMMTLFFILFNTLFSMCDAQGLRKNSTRKISGSIHEASHALMGNNTRNNSTKIALCVIGQKIRMIPKLLLPFLKENSHYRFTLFYALQSGHTKPWKGDIYQQSHYTNMSAYEIRMQLSKVYHSLRNVKVAAVNTSRYITVDEWRMILDPPEDLRALRNYDAHSNVNALNMYNKYHLCAGMLLQYERKHEMQFDYFILGREDIYFFKPMKLAALLPLLQGGREWNQQLHCDYLSKNCLDWCGVNLRFPISTRDVAVAYLQTKLDFYQTLLSAEEVNRPTNTETLDQMHLRNLSFSVCKLPIHDYPVTAVRMSRGEKFCFFPKEIKACIPPSSVSFVLNNLCPSFNCTDVVNDCM